MPRYNFLDEAGLKQYHKLAGYSEIPITDYKSGSLNTENGNVIFNASKRVTDYIELPIYYKYSAVVKGSGIICYYSSSGEFIEAKTFTDSVSFTLNDITKTVNISGAFMTLRAAKIRISCNMQAAVEGTKNTPFIIRSLHDNTSKWLYDEIVENRSDIATNRNDIVETNKTIVRLHADYNFSVSPTTIEKFPFKISGDTATASTTTIKISNAYFTFDKKNVAPTEGYTIDRDGTNLDGDILNTSNYISDDIIDDATYTLTINHFGGKFTRVTGVKAFYPMYFGSSGKSEIEGSDLTSIIKKATTIGAATTIDNVGVFTKQSIGSSPNGTRTFKVNNDEFVYLLVPAGMPQIKGITSGGFKFPLSDIINAVAAKDPAPDPITNSPRADRYYVVYRSASQVNGGTLSIVIS